ncbi:ZIP family metal transporter [Sphingomicrobium aestuariivivum]|uniref:ZIP family metal transporter n=1 Tax=Sphingomicrobium aestuariivivum TaxID=1582356 RepID=UPI001FD7158B|nr:zinc transporter [Sphingomicrobium aestuariivivum]MCJ8192013.1 zinc transporter [Sphingomicrobium aestuariivivum]
MLMMLLVVLVVSGALIIGAAWGVYGKLGTRTESFLVALAGGALLVSVVNEMIEPALETQTPWIAAASVLAGAGVFVFFDALLDKDKDSDDGAGLLLSITLDGVPENLALGVAMIGAGPEEVAALAGSILLSNLPEAAGGAKEMVAGGRKPRSVFLLWSGTALLLFVAAAAGNILLEGVAPAWLTAIRCFAAGAVIASLAIEVFPRAYREKWHMVGIAAALGVIFAFMLEGLGA